MNERKINMLDEKFVNSFLKAWNDHDVNAVMALMTDDCIFEASFGNQVWGTRYEGSEEIETGVKTIFNTIPNIHWEKIRHFICEDHVVVEWLTTGTRSDGTEFEVQGCDILTIRNGKISAKRAYRKCPM
jgi:ketosteroid isomerase-like protein